MQNYNLKNQYMFDEFLAYYEEFVVAAYIEYRDKSVDGVAGRNKDLRAALDAAKTLFHFREHFPDVHSISRSKVEKDCPDYGLLGDVANVSKHKKINKDTPHGSPYINNANCLNEQIINIKYEDSLGQYNYIQKVVVINLAGGATRYLLEVLTNVINFWESHLFSLGLLKSQRTFKNRGIIVSRTRAECKKSSLNFEAISSTRFKQIMQFIKFDMQTGNYSPIDLTGATAQMRIYKPSFEIDISLTEDTTGKTFKATIKLTEEENLYFAGIKNEEEKQAYLSSLPSVKKQFRDLLAVAKS